MFSAIALKAKINSVKFRPFWQKIKGDKRWWLVGAVVVVVILCAARTAWKAAAHDGQSVTQQPMPTPTQMAQPTFQPTPTPLPPFKFARFPFDLKDIGSVAPIGEFGGITRSTAPNSHMYGNYRHYVFSKNPGQYAYNVYVPADGEIIGFRRAQETDQYRFTLSMPGGGKAFYYLDHIQSLSQEFLDKLYPIFGNPIRYTQGVEQLQQDQLIKVKAGDILGQTGLKGIAWDWGVIDPDYCQDIIHPEHYKQDACARSAYDFMTDGMKAQIAPLAGYWAAPPNGIGLIAVKTEPILGQYAHDKVGTLSGGWFEVNQGWQDAFIVPDSYQPNALQIRLAIPELSVFGVWNNLPMSATVNPDPKLVTSASGIVVYKLDKVKARDTFEYGILLARVNDDESVTIETLANQTTVPIHPTFSSKAITLKR